MTTEQILSNQKTMLAHQDTILKNQEEMKHNQEELKKNQKLILANQEKMLVNQEKMFHRPQRAHLCGWPVMPPRRLETTVLDVHDEWEGNNDFKQEN